MKKITVPNPMGNTAGAPVYAYGYDSASIGCYVPGGTAGSYSQYSTGYFQYSVPRGPLSPSSPWDIPIR